MLYGYRINEDGTLFIQALSGLTRGELADAQASGFVTYWTTTGNAHSDAHRLAKVAA